MSTSLQRSYAHCRRLTRRTASSFYYAFWLVPRAKRPSMYALYAFLRRTDDLADDATDAAAQRKRLAHWREALERALAGQCERLEMQAPELEALADTVRRHGIPPRYLHAVIDGVEMDIAGRVYQTFDELADYCYHVATVVGLCCLHVWGYEPQTPDGTPAEQLAHVCGQAFQLTNILRDLHEDAARGRVYLPAEDLRRFGCTADQLRRGVCDERFRNLMRFEIDRAARLFERGTELDACLHPDGRAMFHALIGTYRALLEEIRRRDGDVFARRVELSRWRKLRIAAPWLLRRRGRSAAPRPAAGADVQ